MILWGLGDGQCTQNAFFDEDPTWSITCIIYNSTRLAPGLSGLPFQKKTNIDLHLGNRVYDMTEANRSKTKPVKTCLYYQVTKPSAMRPSPNTIVELR